MGPWKGQSRRRHPASRSSSGGLRSPAILARLAAHLRALPADGLPWYALTLRQWVRRLEARHDEAATLVGEPTYRVWRLYMAASARAFATGKIGVIQFLFSKPDHDGTSGLPLTRSDLYQARRDVVDTGGLK